MARSLYAALAIAFALTGYSLPADRLPEQVVTKLNALPTRGTLRVNVSFSQPAPLAILQQFATADRLTALTYEWNDQKAIYLTQPEDSLEAMTVKFAERLEQVLENGDNIADAEEQLADLRARGIGISAIEVEGSRAELHDAVERIVRAGHGALIEDVGTASTGNDGPVRAEGTASLGAVQSLAGAPYPNEPWRFSPSSGSITNNPSNKTISSTFRWTDISGFDSIHRGYEHDIVVTGIPGFTPGSDWLYWSDLPNWYVDDYAMDTTPTLTIGTAAATSIAANKDYKVIVAYRLGTQNYTGIIGRVDLRPQLGSWANTYDEGDSPSESGEALYCVAAGLGFSARSCIFADQTNFTVKLYESASASAPLYTFAPIDVTQARTFFWNKDITNDSKSCSGQYRAEYYKGNKITDNKLIFVRCEPAVNQNWGYSGPEGDMTNGFSVRWSGTRYFSGGRYRFTLRHDDGASLRIGNLPPLSDLRSGPLTTATTELQLTAGTYNLTTEYYEGTDTASIIMGWEPVAATPATVLSEGAEAGASGWSLGGWTVQTSTSSYGTRRFLIGNGTAYSNNMNASLTSPTFSLSGRKSATLSFAYKFDTEANYDFLWAEASGDGGATWTRVTPKWSGLSPNGAYWSRADIAMPATMLGKSSVRVRFRFTSDSSIYRWGAAVDEIKVVAQ